MLIQSGEHKHLAELLTFMVFGERLAHDCARAQVTLTSDKKLQTFFDSQARQEGYHAILFQGAIRWIAPKAQSPSVVSEQMETYRHHINAAIAQQDFAETLLAEQIILEGLGEAILKRIEAGLVKRGAPFQRLRRTLIHQEEAHYQFGLRVLFTMLERDEESYDSLRSRFQKYLAMAHALLFSTQEAFLAIDENPQDYWDDFYEQLPSWLRTESSPSSSVPVPFIM